MSTQRYMVQIVCTLNIVELLNLVVWTYPLFPSSGTQCTSNITAAVKVVDTFSQKWWQFSPNSSHFCCYVIILLSLITAFLCQDCHFQLRYYLLGTMTSYSIYHHLNTHVTITQKQVSLPSITSGHYTLFVIMWITGAIVDATLWCK